MPGDQPLASADHVSVRLNYGSEIAHEPVAYAEGSWQKPLDREELSVKFLECAKRRVDRAQAISLFDQLWELDRLPSIRQLRLTGKATNAWRRAAGDENELGADPVRPRPRLLPTGLRQRACEKSACRIAIPLVAARPMFDPTRAIPNNPKKRRME